MSMRASVLLPNRHKQGWIALLAVACLVWTSSVVPAVAIDASREAQLTVLVRQDCGSCHGMTLKGGLGKPLLPGDLAHLDAESIAAIILDGVPGQPMPAWKDLISSGDAQWIAQRLKEGFPE